MAIWVAFIVRHFGLFDMSTHKFIVKNINRRIMLFGRVANNQSAKFRRKVEPSSDSEGCTKVGKQLEYKYNSVSRPES